MSTTGTRKGGNNQNPRSRGRFAIAQETLQRDAAAFNMKSRGCTHNEIAIALGFTDGPHVAKALRRHLERAITPAVDEYRALMDHQLDEMHRAVLRVLETTHLKISDGRVVYYDDETSGQPKPLLDDSPVLASVDRLLKIQDQRAKLYGLYAPTKVDVRNVTVRVEGAEDV